MSGSTLDPDATPIDLSGTHTKGKEHGARAWGPSDLSHSGSDTVGSVEYDGIASSGRAAHNPALGPTQTRLESETSSDTDAAGTGERASVENEPATRVNRDIGFDRVVDAGEVGLGGGLDQAEEGRLGVTDEEIERLRQPKAPNR
jgi:hypothetical protein